MKAIEKIKEVINDLPKYLCNTESLVKQLNEAIAELSQEAEPQDFHSPEDFKTCEYCKFQMFPFTNQPCAECSNNFTNKWQPNSDNPKEPLKPNKPVCQKSVCDKISKTITKLTSKGVKMKAIEKINLIEQLKNSIERAENNGSETVVMVGKSDALKILAELTQFQIPIPVEPPVLKEKRFG